MISKDFFGRVDFDFWCNSKKSIVILLLEKGRLSISEVARSIGLSYGTTHSHIMKLQEKGALDTERQGSLVMVFLKVTDLERLLSL